MLFNSYSFAIFFALVLLISRLHWSWWGRKLFLLIASYVFYAAWNPPFVILLLISTVGDWWFAKAMHRTDSLTARRGLMLGSLALNLGMLGYFKYGGFVLANFAVLARTAGVNWEPAAPSIILPVGISFYTFQTLSYTIDVYRRHSSPGRSYLDYSLYVTFFPQLVAGPIVRSSEFLPQCEQPKRATDAQLGWGLMLIAVGLFNKVVIADRLMSTIADAVYTSPTAPNALSAWAGTLAFAVQIFCDFAGYSTCAIGVALCLGFALPDNFRFPYAAIGFSDFWRRWHISLSTWLRDYLYIPMGGNRGGALATYRNLAVTMLLGGLWHGASWMFVIWGGLHGAYLSLERLFRARIPADRLSARLHVRYLLALGTFAAVCITWVFFRARSVESAWGILSAMFGAGGHEATAVLPTTKIATAFLVAAAMLSLHWTLRDRSLEEAVEKIPIWVRVPILVGMLLLTLMSQTGENNAFIYFQF